MKRVINKRELFTELFKNGKRFHQKYVTLILSQQPVLNGEFATLCYKKTANAVIRNRSRRRIKSIIMQALSNKNWQQNFLMVAKKNSHNVDFQELKAQVEGLLNHVK